MNPSTPGNHIFPLECISVYFSPLPAPHSAKPLPFLSWTPAGALILLYVSPLASCDPSPHGNLGWPFQNASLIMTLQWVMWLPLARRMDSNVCTGPVRPPFSTGMLGWCLCCSILSVEPSRVLSTQQVFNKYLERMFEYMVAISSLDFIQSTMSKGGNEQWKILCPICWWILIKRTVTAHSLWSSSHVRYFPSGVRGWYRCVKGFGWGLGGISICLNIISSW